MTPAELHGHLADPAIGFRGKLTPAADLAKITWFRTGGAADLLFQPADEADLAAFLAVLPEGVPLTPVGIGSNLLIRDGGVGGVVLRLPAKGFGEVEALGDGRIHAGAAASDKRVAAMALEAGLGGFHFLHGIPGSAGGAIRKAPGASPPPVAGGRSGQPGSARPSAWPPPARPGPPPARLPRRPRPA